LSSLTFKKNGVNFDPGSISVSGTAGSGLMQLILSNSINNEDTFTMSDRGEFAHLESEDSSYFTPLTDFAVTNVSTDTVPPTLQAAQISNGQIKLDFSEEIHVAGTIVVKKNGVLWFTTSNFTTNVSSSVFDAPNTPGASDTITLSFVGSVVYDLIGNNSLGVSDYAVVNKEKPTLTNASVSQSAVSLTFDAPVAIQSLTGVTIQQGSTPLSIVSSSVSSSTVTLNLNTDISPELTYTISYGGNFVYKTVVFGAFAATTTNYTLVNSSESSAPSISNVTISSLSDTSSLISWDTNEGADSLVEYGLTSLYTSSSTLNSAYTMSHSIRISNLSPQTTYHYRVISKDFFGNISTSSDAQFTTTASAPAVVPGSVSYSSGGSSASSIAVQSVQQVAPPQVVTPPVVVESKPKPKPKPIVKPVAKVTSKPTPKTIQEPISDSTEPTSNYSPDVFNPTNSNVGGNSAPSNAGNAGTGGSGGAGGAGSGSQGLVKTPTASSTRSTTTVPTQTRKPVTPKQAEPESSYEQPTVSTFILKSLKESVLYVGTNVSSYIQTIFKKFGELF
jgi:hypothetical protein